MKPPKKYQTGQRKRMLALFEASAHRCLSAQDVAEALKEENISMSAIYRNLSEMEKAGLISKVVDNKRQAAHYQYLNPENCCGLIHLKCQTCDETYHLDKCVSDMLIAMAESHFHFKLNHSTPFIFGQCEQCAQAEEKSTL